VVLPIQLNGSKPIAHEYRDGIMVALIQRLTDDAKAADFPQIVPAAEIRRKKVEGIFQIRNRLDAELAVRGKLRVDVEGANLRLELIDVHRLSVLHAEIIAGRDMLELVEGAHQAIKGFLSPAQLAVAETGTSAIENQGSQNERQAYDAYLQGEGLLFRDDRKGNLGRAVSAFEQAVDLAPAQASYQAALARALLRRFHVLKQGRDLVAAREASQKALALNDQLALAWQTYGAVAFEEGSYEQAVEALERAQLLNPLAVANYLLLGRIYARIGDPRAEQAYQRACELQPDNWKSQLQLGNFHLRRGGYEKAEQAFQLVRGLVPDSSVGYQSLATVYQLQGRLELALQHYQRALEIRPGGAIALSNMGAIFMSLGRFEEAANAFQRSVNLNPRNPFSQGNLGDAFRFLEGEAAASEQAYQQAITLLREQIETNPNEPGSRIFLANYLAKAGRTETAVETLAQIEGLDRLAEVVPLYTIGQTYAIIGRRDRALEFIGKALAQGYPARELQHDPFMTEFRRDPAYDELVTPAR
jgi:tetratricopeptide (TPR) repeat protein